MGKRVHDEELLKKTSRYLIEAFPDELRNNDVVGILTKVKYIKGIYHSSHRFYSASEAEAATINTKAILDIFDQIGLDYDDYVIEQPRSNSNGVKYTISGGYPSSKYGGELKDENGNPVKDERGFTKYKRIPTTTNRYAGVNNHGKACILTMGEYRTPTARVYFTDESMANSFLEKYNKKFDDRGLNFKVKKIDNRNPMIDRDILCRVHSDCGDCFQLFD